MKIIISCLALILSSSLYADVIFLDRNQKKSLINKLSKIGQYRCNDILLVKEDPMIDGLYLISCQSGLGGIYEIEWWRKKIGEEIKHKFELNCYNTYDTKGCRHMEEMAEYSRKIVKREAKFK